MLNRPIRSYIRQVASSSILPFIYPHHILIACFPKSGSTFTTNVLHEMTRFKVHTLHHDACAEQNLNKRRLGHYSRRNLILHQHLPGTDGNLGLLKKYGFKNIILLRNIFDVCPSLFDHLHKEDLNQWHCHLTKDFYQHSDETKMNIIVDLIIPWYFKFYVSWHYAEQTGKADVLWITYEEMVQDKRLYFSKILNYCGVKFDETCLDKITNVPRDSSSRYNKGVVGRGKAMLSGAQQERIRRMASYYPEVDFTRIGITQEGSASGSFIDAAA